MFVALTWTVAGSFVLFDVLTLEIGGRLAEAGSLLMAVQKSQVCVASGSRTEATTAVASDARRDAWMLGVSLGLHARATLMLAEAERTATPQTRDRLQDTRVMVGRSAAEIARLAAALQVPPLAAFVPSNLAMENVDFPAFVEGNENQTGRVLAAAYGGDTCRLFQMGLYWGHSALVRTMLPGEANIHAAEIRHYAQVIGLPDPLWQRMVSRTAPDATGEALAAEVDTVTNAVASHVAGSSNGSGAPRQ